MAHLPRLTPEGAVSNIDEQGLTHATASTVIAYRDNQDETVDVTPTQPLPISDPMLDISMGVKLGYSWVNKFGQNTAVASGGTEEIWDGSTTYTWPTSATITHVRAAVDSATTQGQVVEVQGLDASYVLRIQNATLDGADSTTEVALSPPLIRVFRMKVLDGTASDQDIQAGPTGFASQQAIITAGNNQTLMAIYTIPAGKTGYLVTWYAAINPATNQDPTSMPIRVWARDNTNGYAPQIKHIHGITTGHVQHFYKPYQKYQEKTDIWMTAAPVGKAADVSAGFDIILVEN